MSEQPSPRERLEAVERALRVQRVLSSVLGLVSVGAVLLAISVRGGGASASSPWTVNADGELVFPGNIWAHNFVSMGGDGKREVVLGVGTCTDSDPGPGIFVYDKQGDHAVAAMWRETWAGRSRMRIGDVGTNPIDICGNGIDASLIAPSLRCYSDPIVWRD